jgi:hypothetical protein
MLLVWSSFASAACLTSSAVVDVDARLAAAESAWANLDGEAFDQALDEAVLLLPCLAEVAPPSFAARYHRMIALRAWGARDVERATWSLTAARTLEPTYVFPPELLAPDHELSIAYRAITPGPGATRTPARPRGGALWFDGVGREEPLDRATIAQIEAGDGSVQTRLLRPGDPLPAYDAVPRTRNAILFASGAVLTAGVGFYAAAWGTHAPFYDPGAENDVADLERLASRSQLLTGLSVGCAALAASGVGVAFAFGGS